MIVKTLSLIFDANGKPNTNIGLLLDEICFVVLRAGIGILN